jgi:hypothetical protein
MDALYWLCVVVAGSALVLISAVGHGKAADPVGRQKRDPASDQCPAALAVVVICGGIAMASYPPGDSSDSRNSWLISRYELQPSQNCRIISVASLRPPTMHIRLSDRHAGKAAEAPVVPGRGFSASASGAPCDDLR